jgi:hypothetical protein
MLTKKFESLGLVLSLMVPAAVDEYDTLAKKPGACLEDAIDNVVYRGALADFRFYFCEALEETTKIERKTKPVLDDKGVQKTKKVNGVDEPQWAYDESEATYVKRVCLQTGKKITDFQSLADEVMARTKEVKDGDVVTNINLIRFDPTPSERGPGGPKKIAKVYIEAAEKVIAQGKESQVAAALAKILGHPVEATKDGLSAAISENELNKQREQQKKLADSVLGLVQS